MNYEYIVINMIIILYVSSNSYKSLSNKYIYILKYPYKYSSLKYKIKITTINAKIKLICFKI